LILNAYKILVVKPTRKIPLRGPRRRWKGNYRNSVGRCGLDSSGSGYGL